jgi:hypothetical protein
MERKTVSGIILALLLASTLTLTFDIKPVKAFGMVYINDFIMTVTPESPKFDDDVHVKVNFTTASASYTVAFSAVRFDGIDQFYAGIGITIPEVVVPEIGFAEKTFDLGRIAEGAYIFNADILVANFEGKELFRTWRGKSFAVEGVQLSTLAAPLIKDDSLMPDSIFRINITVDDVEKLWGYQFALWYDVNVLTAIDLGSYPPFDTPIVSELNEVVGYVDMAFCTFFGDREGFSTLDPTPIAWIDFYVNSIGTSILDFSYFSELVTILAKVIPHEEVKGFFDNRPHVVTATVDIDPDNLNLMSKEKWMTAFIQPPEGYKAADINAATIFLDGTIQPVLDSKYDFATDPDEYLVDHNGDGILERMVKFSRATVISHIIDSLDAIELGVNNIKLTLTGKFITLSSFMGSDTLRVILRNAKRSNFSWLRRICLRLFARHP